MAITKTKIILLTAVAGISYIAYGKFMPQGPGGWGMDGAAPVSVAEVVERNVQQWHEFSGRLVAVEQVDIRPRVSGTIDAIHFKNGAQVNAGDMLFTIDPKPYEAALTAAAARASLAEAELRRAQKLLADKAVPQREYDQRKNDAAIARADLTTATLNLQYTKIMSPISGRVGRAEITQGNLVESGGGAPVLTTVVSNSPIYADFEVDETTYLQYIRATGAAMDSSKMPVAMALASDVDFPHQGSIESFDNQLNNASGTIRVRASFPNNEGNLVPGLFARIRLGDAGDSKALLVTDRAIGTDQNKKFVLVVGAENKVEYREIKPGNLSDGLRIVSDGLKPGEKIVVNGLQRARPGMPVVPEMVPMDGKEAPQADKPENAEAQKPS
jgi:multidrug efflux system membrane fusion protein